MRKVGRMAKFLCSLLLTAQTAYAGMSLPNSKPCLTQIPAEIREFDLEDLTDVDMRRKKLYVNVIIGEGAAQEAYRNIGEFVERNEKEFYGRYGVDIVYLHDKFLPRSINVITMNIVETTSMPADCEGLIACAIEEKRELFYGISKNLPSQIDKDRAVIINKWWQDIAHEKGHLLGLYHTDTLKNSKIPELWGTGENLMARISNEGGAYNVILEPEQVRIVHSFLAGEQAYRARRKTLAPGIDASEYYERIDEAIAARIAAKKDCDD